MAANENTIGTRINRAFNAVHDELNKDHEIAGEVYVLLAELEVELRKIVDFNGELLSQP